MYGKKQARSLALLLLLSPASAALGDVLFFDSQDEFEVFNTDKGKFIKGTETFEEGGPGPGEVLFDGDPLCGGIPNGDLAYPTGLENPNLCLEALPSDIGVLVAAGAGAYGPGMPNSTVIGNDPGSLLLDFLDEDKTAIGFDVGDLVQAGNCDMTVFGLDGSELGSTVWPCLLFDKTFFGVWSSDPIGSIEVGGNAWEFVDDVQMWVPEPCTLALVALGAMGLMRRQNRLTRACPRR